MLSNIDNKKNPFKVPENYFENFNTEIMGKLPQKEIPKAKIVPLWRKVVPWVAVAAVFSGVLFFSGVFNEDTTSTTIAMSEPKESAIINGMGASSSFEEDYRLFLEDEVSKAHYNDIMFNN